MEQYVNRPTKITKDSRTIIDLIFSNRKLEVQIIYEPKITDHAWLKIEINECKSGIKFREFSARNYSKFDPEKFVSLVDNKLKHNGNLDVRTKAIKFVNNIVDALDAIVSRKQFRIPKIWEGKRWFYEIRETVDRKDEAYKKARYEDTEQS